MLDPNALALFPTLVLHCPEVLSQSETRDIFGDLKSRDTPLHLSMSSGRSSHGQRVDLIGSLGLSEKIQHHLDNYARELGINPLSVIDSWYNIQDVGSTLAQHIHPGSFVSAALYINVDDSSSKLFFENPNSLSTYTWQTDNDSPYGINRYSVTPKNGDMYIFPSWLKHGSLNTQNFTESRTVISLNSIPCILKEAISYDYQNTHN